MSDPHRLARDLAQLLVHLIRAALPADEADARPARREALRLHEAVRSDLASADPGAIHLDGLWAAAKEEVDTPELDREELRVSKRLTAACPLSLGDLVGPGLALGEIEDRIRAAAATG